MVYPGLAYGWSINKSGNYGRNSDNSRNGKRPKQLRTSAGDTTIQLPRDRNSEFSSKLLAKHQTSTNELEEKILAMYGVWKGHVYP